MSHFPDNCRIVSSISNLRKHKEWKRHYNTLMIVIPMSIWVIMGKHDIYIYYLQRLRFYTWGIANTKFKVKKNKQITSSLRESFLGFEKS